ncbi:uroporphyrin-III C-methyltransferase/precorrin-2 dehydrogenase/sirohydrochlorin ferrochelatase [Pseudorhizobium tarimense]|uniref:Uroporphyrin-III C-methyltransferase/precorrin-2 dehydrogenase/sirohydrochlorin ferrochelatase n=1 Tax=Pseudorhizobium tarimense TaxID=1079109 RepID=A0ABV2HEC0_9HYPH|nr:siroheme synthase CysG [Pseudorhizobium tarimense]MCJ8521715.1 siroheme synthase CysG [Pseudorhizobium tarimense]
MTDPDLRERRVADRKAARIEALAKLPVFWDLMGKRVVMAGGSDAAAWKSELLHACGAEVHVFAPQEAVSDTFRRLLEQDAEPEPGGGYVHHDRCWGIDIFAGAAIAIADCDEEAEAQAFFCAARAAGVPVNVIDKPALCQFQFGSIVNRSPVVVAVSTDGAAPILAQAIRRCIETLLPPSLKAWSRLAQSIRESINSQLSGLARRKFWEDFVDEALAQNDDPDVAAAERLVALAATAGARPATGRVTLVGAGPGDAEYLTLKAVRALQAADVILFDDLVSDEVLELARREAKRLLVGKRGGRESCRQDEINQMMIDLAKAGKNVVRLKSGDPAIFGRAGEELAVLARHGIASQVVPGITAASAMASRLGVSLTHRDHAQAVRFVTGHARDGRLPDTLDWKALADAATTTVFYMGGRTAGEIRERLLYRGMDPATPAVIVSSVSRAGERRWRGSVEELHIGIAEIGFEDPVLVGIGQVFRAVAVAGEHPGTPFDLRAAADTTKRLASNLS